MLTHLNGKSAIKNAARVIFFHPCPKDCVRLSKMNSAGERSPELITAAADGNVASRKKSTQYGYLPCLPVPV